VLLSLGRFLCWWTIIPRRYHPPSSQCYYHWVDTSAGGLLCLGSIIHPVVSVTITDSIPLLVDYFPRRYHPPSSPCCYHWVVTSADGLLFPRGIIHPVVSVSTLTWLIRYIPATLLLLLSCRMLYYNGPMLCNQLMPRYVLELYEQHSKSTDIFDILLKSAVRKLEKS
jgi:hypothetical protein